MESRELEVSRRCCSWRADARVKIDRYINDRSGSGGIGRSLFVHRTRRTRSLYTSPRAVHLFRAYTRTPFALILLRESWDSRADARMFFTNFAKSTSGFSDSSAAAQNFLIIQIRKLCLLRKYMFISVN